MTLDGPMLTALGVLFTTATGAVGWLIGKLWTENSELQIKVFTMLEKQYEATGNRKDLFDNLGRTIDGLAQNQIRLSDGFSQSIKDLTREVQSMRSDVQKIRP